MLTLNLQMKRNGSSNDQVSADPKPQLKLHHWRTFRVLWVDPDFWYTSEMVICSCMSDRRICALLVATWNIPVLLSNIHVCIEIYQNYITIIKLERLTFQISVTQLQKIHWTCLQVNQMVCLHYPLLLQWQYSLPCSSYRQWMSHTVGRRKDAGKKDRITVRTHGEK